MALIFPAKIPFKKGFKIRRFSYSASRSSFGAAICVALVRTSIVFCNSVSADRSGMAASRFLAAADACGILVYVLRLKVINCIAVAAGKSCEWCLGSRCFFILALIFPAKIPFKKGFKIRRFSYSASRSSFGAAICVALVRTSIVFCNAVSADRSGRDLAVSAGSVQLFCSRPCWHV